METATCSQKAHSAIRHVLSGNSPNGISPEECGAWAEVVQDLYEAHAEGGTVAVKQVFSAVARLEPELAKLVAGEEPEIPRYTLHTAAEALEPQPPIEWVISGLFSAGTVAILVGDPGTAKTYSLLDAAICVAEGKPWLEYTTTQGPVLVVDEESGPRRLARRLGDCLRGHGGTAATPVYYTTLERFNLRKPEDIQALRDAIEETHARFVLIDALVDVMPGADENAVGDVQPVFIALRDIAESAGAVIVVIHHTNKAGNYRGSSAMLGAVDLQVKVTKSGSHISFDIQKARDTELFNFAARGNWEEHRFYLEQAEPQSMRPKYSKSKRYVLRYLLEHGANTTADIKSNADTCSPEAARQAIYALTEEGLTHRTDDGGSGSLATYDLTDKGRAVAKEMV